MFSTIDLCEMIMQLSPFLSYKYLHQHGTIIHTFRKYQQYPAVDQRLPTPWCQQWRWQRTVSVPGPCAPQSPSPIRWQSYVRPRPTEWWCNCRCPDRWQLHTILPNNATGRMWTWPIRRANIWHRAPCSWGTCDGERPKMHTNSIWNRRERVSNRRCSSRWSRAFSSSPPAPWEWIPVRFHTWTCWCWQWRSTIRQPSTQHPNRSTADWRSTDGLWKINSNVQRENANGINTQLELKHYCTSLIASKFRGRVAVIMSDKHRINSRFLRQHVCCCSLSHQPLVTWNDDFNIESCALCSPYDAHIFAQHIAVMCFVPIHALDTDANNFNVTACTRAYAACVLLCVADVYSISSSHQGQTPEQMSRNNPWDLLIEIKDPYYFWAQHVWSSRTEDLISRHDLTSK